MYYLSLNYLKDRGPGPERELLPEITSYLKDQSAWQGQLLITKHLFFLLSYESYSSLKPQTSIP